MGGLGGVYQFASDPFNPAQFAQWHKFGSMLPKVLVADLHYDPTDDILVAGTFGRGAWSIKNFSAQKNIFPTAGGAGLAQAAFEPDDLAAGSEVPAGNALGGFVLELAGTAGNDDVLVRRDPMNPALLQVLSGGQPVDLGGPVEVVSVAQVVFDGMGGDDHFTVDVSNGVVGFPGSSLTDGQTSIVFHGGGGIDTFEMLGGPVMTQASNFDAMTKMGTFLLAGDDAIGEYRVDDVEVVQQNQLASPTSDRLRALGAGLEHLADWSGGMLTSLASPIAALGDSWTKVLNGLNVEPDEESLSDPEAEDETGAGQGLATGAADDGGDDDGGEVEEEEGGDGGGGPTAVRGTIGVATSEILRRLFETGDDRLMFAEIGTFITTTSELVSRLDVLGDVTVVQDDANGLILDVQIEKRLDGEAELDVDVLDGAVGIAGDVKVSADVTAKLRLGVDSRGFFIDADATSDPEIVIRNFEVDGDIQAIGKVGFLGVEIDGASLEVDPNVAIKIDIRDPGADPLVGDQDGVVRVYELAAEPTTMASATIVGNSQADDLVLKLDAKALPIFDAIEPLFELADATLELHFADINAPDHAELTVSSQAGQELVDFLNADIPEIVDGIQQIASTFQSFTGVDVLATKIPILGKSIGDLLSSVPKPVDLTSDMITAVGDVNQDGGTSFFAVNVNVDLVKEGVAVGNVVHFRGTGGSTVDGEVASVEASSFTVKFSGSEGPDRTSPSMQIVKKGGLGDQLSSLIGHSATTLVDSGTIQGLVEEIAQRLGIDGDKFEIEDGGAADGRVIMVKLPLDIDPFVYETTVDFSGQIPGLALSGAGKVLVTIDPDFEIEVGIRLGSGISPAERVFIVDNADPEVSLHVTAQLDDPVIHGSLGLLDLTLAEQALPVNQGILIDGTITVNLHEPTMGDGRITLGDLAGGSFTDFIDVGIDASFDIDGLELKAGGALSGALGTIKISLDGSGPGHVTSLAGLTNLPSALNIQGLDEFLNFDNLSAVALQQILLQLRSWLDSLQGSSVFTTGIPFTSKTLGDAIDMGTAFFDSVVGVLDNPRLVAEGLAAADGQLEKDVNLSLSVNDSIDLNFKILASETMDNASLDDLAADIRAALAIALQNAGLPNALDVGVRQGALTIFAKTDDIKGLAVSASDAAIGFAKDQLSDAIGYRSLDEFFAMLASRLPGPLNPAYDAASNRLSFTLAFDKSLAANNLPLDFSLGLGSLAEISTSSQISVTGEAMGSLRVGINLSDLTGGFQLQNSTPLSTLKKGQGVVIPADSPSTIKDIRITLRNGSTVDVDLTTAMTTIGDIVNAIKNASPFLAGSGIDPATQQAIRIVDSSTGSAMLSVAALPGSLAALDLGLVGLDADGDGILVGQPLHGVTDGDRFSIDVAGSSLGGNISLVANDVDATARVGFVDVSIVNGHGSASAAVNVSLNDPGTGAADGRITLDELFGALADNPASLITVLGPTGSASFDLPIQINPAPLLPPADPHLIVSMTNLFDPATFSAAITPQFDLLSGLEDFAFSQLIDGLRHVQTLLADVENINLFKQQLPLVNTSLADMLGLSEKFGRVINRLEADQPRTINQFRQSLDTAIQAELTGTTIPNLNITLVPASSTST